jgi:exodeoxyribonuclease-3
MAPFRIISWNVNGIRAAARKGFLGWLELSDADVVAVQETKAAPEQLTFDLREPPGYYASWCAAEKAGYSGVATFSRQEPLEVRRGLGEPRFDVEGRVLACVFPALILYNIYFPSGNQGPERVAYKLAFYRRFLELIGPQVASGRSLVVVGDVNTAYAEIDLARPRENLNTSGFMPIERAALSEFFAAGLVDSFRHHHPDLRKYSWWTMRVDARARNVGWRLDYILTSPDLAGRIIAADTHPEVEGSDHCPVSLVLDL